MIVLSSSRVKQASPARSSPAGDGVSNVIRHTHDAGRSPTDGCGQMPVAVFDHGFRSFLPVRIPVAPDSFLHAGDTLGYERLR